MLALWRTAQTGSFPRSSLLRCTTRFSPEAVLTSSVRSSSGPLIQIAVGPLTSEVHKIQYLSGNSNRLQLTGIFLVFTVLDRNLNKLYQLIQIIYTIAVDF